MVSQFECPACGVELDAEKNFCVNCGTDISGTETKDTEEVCPDCGVEVPAADNFCTNCGATLSDQQEQIDEEESFKGPIDALESESDDSESVPESLTLACAGYEISVTDGDTVGREIRAALNEAGRPETEVLRIHREHVRFLRKSDSFYLLDMGENPTQLNGRELSKGDRKAVSPGDELELSNVAEIHIQSP